MGKFYLAALIGLSYLSSSYVTTAVASELPAFPFVSVQGQASISVAPDQATVYLNVLTTDKQADVALKQLTDTGSLLLELAKAHGIAEKQIESQQINKQILRDHRYDKKAPEILGYEMRQSYQIEINQLANFSQFTDALLSLPHTENISTRFGLKEQAKIERELIQQATADAAMRAQDLALGVGASLGKAYAVTQGHPQANFLVGFGVGQISPRAYAAEGLMMHKSARSNLTVPEDIELSQQVSVIYRLAE